MDADVFGLKSWRNSMIIVKLMGGLGNQMFQYSFGRAVSLAQNIELKLDISWFENLPSKDTVRVYELDTFNFNSIFANKNEVNKLKGIYRYIPKKVYNLVSKIGISFGNSYFIEKEYTYNSNFFQDNTYFEGFWQSYRYFDSFKEEIIQDFTCKLPLQGKNKELSTHIQSCEAISLHIRRGDYVSNVNASNFHGISPLDYYYKAIDLLSKNVEEPSFFIFSDDITWVKENLKIEYPITFVDHNSLHQGFEDMRLMSMCKHNIIANSSFSWWGAYLNGYEKKIVIAPQKWFNNPSIDTSDLIPSEWIRL